MRRITIESQQWEVLRTYIKLIRAADTVTSRIHKHLALHRLTFSQFGVLEALYSLGDMSQKVLSQKILKSGGNLTMVIDNLCRRGLVERIQDPGDRRINIIHLTHSGEELMEVVFPLHARAAAGIFSVLNDDQLRELGRYLKILGKSNS
ncbi:MAG: MarR family transcriptional regulator [Chitinivibrionales bacterium]|nr:MarR family transcriptional regulator [Chitinivibrionales bacterium]